MLKKEYEIVEPFVKKPWKSYTFNEVKKISRKSSESYVYNTLKKFVKEQVLKEENIGNVIKYSLKLENAKAQSYSGIVAEYLGWNKKHLPYEQLNKIIKKIPAGFYTILITGSYASNKQTEKSDLDVVIICDETFEPKKIYAELRHECEMSIPTIHLYVFKKTEFMLMLKGEKANYGKETARNNIILAGGNAYFRMISEVIRNGFDG
jgi:predicted nucleotidyltransferase